MMRPTMSRPPLRWILSSLLLLPAPVAGVGGVLAASGTGTAGEDSCRQASGEQVYYVDVDSRCGPCSDGYSKRKNSVSRPFCTLAHAIRVAAPGDTFLVQDGRYGEEKNFTASGRKDQPVVYRALGKRAVVGVFDDVRDEDFESAGPENVWSIPWKRACCEGYTLYQTHYDPILVDDPNPSRFVLDPRDGPVRLSWAADRDTLAEEPGTWHYDERKLYVHPYDSRRPSTEGTDIVVGYKEWGLHVGKSVEHMVLDGFRVEYGGAYHLVVEGSHITLRNLWVTSGLSLRGHHNTMENITATHKISRKPPRYLWHESGRGTGLGFGGEHNSLKNAHIFHNWNNFNMRGRSNRAMNLHIHGAPNHCWQTGYMKDSLVQNAVVYNCQDGVGYVAGGLESSVFEGVVTQGSLLLQEHNEKNRDIVFRNSIFAGCKLTFGGGGVQSCEFQGTITVENTILFCKKGKRPTVSHCSGPDRKKTVYDMDAYREACVNGELSDCMTLREIKVVDRDYDSVLAGGVWKADTDEWDVRVISRESPAYDAGSSEATAAEDMKGAPRPQGKGYEIGADELDERERPRAADRGD